MDVDGGIHQQSDMQARDKARQKLIELCGIRVFRCTADEVEHNLKGVLEGILKAVE